MDGKHSSPDFIVIRDGIEVAVEATTLNPSQSGSLSNARRLSERTESELTSYQDDELPIRFGGVLRNKLLKRYWKLENCKGNPLVFAVECFNDKLALTFSDAGLSQYLYGMRHTASRAPSGLAQVEYEPIERHSVGRKQIDSNFFAQPDTENVSAAIFTNAGTSAKFSRMGYQHGHGNDTIDMTRIGYFWNPDPTALDPTYFSYNLSEPRVVESWGQGLVVNHNPNALHPIPNDFFVGAVNHRIEDGRLVSEGRSWHPMSSKTPT